MSISVLRNSLSSIKLSLDTIWLSIAIFAASMEAIVIKLGYMQHLDMLHLIIIRSFFAGLFILPFMFSNKFRFPDLRAVSRISVLAMLLLANTVSMFAALQHVSVVTLITVSTTTPAFVAIVNGMLGRDRLSPKFWLGFFLCFAGVICSVDAFSVAGDLAGYFYLALVVLTSTLYRVRSETLTRRYTPGAVSLCIFTMNGLLAMPFALMLIPKVSHVTLAMGVWIGFTASIANVAFLLLLSLLGSTRVSIVYMLQRPLVVLLAAPILHEPLHWYQILGIALVFYGVHLAKVEKTVSVQASTSCGEAKLDSNGRDVRDMASSGKR